MDPGYADPCPLCCQPVSLVRVLTHGDEVYAWQSITPQKYIALYTTYELEHPSGSLCVFTEDVLRLQIRGRKLLFWFNGHRLNRRRRTW